MLSGRRWTRGFKPRAFCLGVKAPSGLNPCTSPSRCWMRNTPQALLAHYLINISMLVGLVSSGLLMLFLVYWKIRTRNEWRHKKVAFLSIWGLSCLFGTTWGLGFLDFGPLSTFVLFLSCILNSLQGEQQICQCLSLSPRWSLWSTS